MSKPVDPAKTVKRTKQELVDLVQEGCKRVACAGIQSGIIKCPFCPWIKKYFFNT